MKKSPQQNLPSALDMFRGWLLSWLKTNPDRELLNIVHAQIGRLYTDIGKQLKNCDK